ncbi:MAG TPA: hypothetical protein VKG38_01585 [Solirubrobacteraceae bacterium]|nr:hypothetical protein [Solirubrobacteraceae bacterium]
MGQAKTLGGTGVAYIRITRPQSLTGYVYDAISIELDLGRDHPLGLIAHAAGEADGSWHIVEIWESEDFAQRFDRERLVPAIEAVTGRPPPRNAPTVAFELRGLVTP